MKKITSLLILMCICLSFCGCGGSKVANVTMEKGNIPVKMAKIDFSEAPSAVGAPILGEITVKASADDSINVAGKGFFSEKLKFFICSLDSGKKYQAKFTAVDDNLAVVTVDKTIAKGIFAVYAENETGKSNVKYVNAPKIWSVNFTKLTAGEEFCIYGENLSLAKNKTKVYLVSSDNYCEPEMVYVDPYKITIKMPSVLKDGEGYDLYVYSGFGGQTGLVKYDKKIIYSAKDPVVFEGKTIDVTDYGADARDIRNDDTKAIKKAIDAAEDGDILFFPEGYYLVNKDLEIKTSLRLLGDGAEKSIILSGNGVEKYTLTLRGTPCEVKGLGFEQKRSNGKIDTNLINAIGDNFESGSWSFYIHDCRLVQNTTKKYTSRVYPINATNCNGMRIENNTLDTFGFLEGAGLKNVIIKDNEFSSNFLSGYYYGQDSFHIGSAETFDLSDNIIQGKGAKPADNFLDYDNYTAGRCVVFRVATNVYLGGNKFRKAGIPHCNAGEMFLLENLEVKYDGKIASADKNTIILPDSANFQVSKGDIFSVVAGEGLYQYRTVVSAKGKKVVLDRQFDVLPNEDSRVIVSHCFANIALYNNVFDGHTTWDEYPGATTSLQAYGSTHNLFMEKNLLRNMPEGICITPYYYNPAQNTNKAVISWCVFDDNVFENNGVGVRYCPSVDPGSGKIPACVSFGMAFRRNNFVSTPEYKHIDWLGLGGIAIQMGTLTKHATGDRWPGDWINGILIENNTFKNSEVSDISLGMHQNNILLRNNGKDMTVKIYENGNSAKVIDY